MTTAMLLQAGDLAGEARKIAQKALDEGRDMTAAERTVYDQKATEAIRLKTTHDTNAAVLVEAKRLADLTGIIDPAGDVLAGPAPRANGRGGSAWAKSVEQKMRDTAAGLNVKALATGSIDIHAVLSPDVTPIPGVPIRLIDVVVNREGLAGNTYDYLRQTVRTNNAAPVPDGALKPTSVYTFQNISDRARVFAHLSEPIPERYFSDRPTLIQLLQGQMEEGLIEKIEGQVVTGTGTGENFTGILNTSGIQSVAFLTDKLTTCRRARTTMANAGENPTAWIFNPNDAEAIDLTKDTTGAFLLAGNDAAAANIFGAIPRLTSPNVPAGKALLGDFEQCRLYVREDARLDADRSGTNFTTNQVVLRVEGRYGFAVLRPQAFAVVNFV